MNIINRITSETPKFFKQVIALSLTLSLAATAILTAGNVIEGFVLSEKITHACQWAIVAGLVAAAVSKTTVQK